MNKVSGHLEIMDKGFGFLRSLTKNFEPAPTDPFVPATLIRQFDLREGSFIEGKGGAGPKDATNLQLRSIDQVNGVSPEESMQVEQLWNRVSINPEERFRMTLAPNDLMGMALDVIVPVAAAAQHEGEIARLAYLGIKQEQSTDIEIQTAEGDTVTISSDARTEAALLTYKHLAFNGEGYDAEQLQLVDFQADSSFELSVVGDLNEREKADIEALLQDIGARLKAFLPAARMPPARPRPRAGTRASNRSRPTSRCTASSPI